MIDTTTTDVNGYYEFTGLAAGNYTVREELPAGWVNCTDTSVEVTLGAGQNTVVSNPTPTDTLYWDGDSWEPSLAAWVHASWVTDLDHTFPMSTWVWESYQVDEPINGDVVEFKHSFDIPGTPQPARYISPLTTATR